MLNLSVYGITVNFNKSKNGRISGISFQKEGFSIKGSKLGSKYSYAALSRKLPLLAEIRTVNEQVLIRNRELFRTR